MNDIWIGILWMVCASILFLSVVAHADNSTRKDWGGDDKGRYCEMIQHDVTIYPNGTSSGTFKTIKFLCEKSA